MAASERKEHTLNHGTITIRIIIPCLNTNFKSQSINKGKLIVCKLRLKVKAVANKLFDCV